MADYDSLFNLPTGTEDISSVFKTGRGSTYAHHNDNTTTRNRSGENHRDTSTGIQQRSGKTIFMDPKDVNNIAGLYQNAEMGTKFVPVLENGKPTGKVALQLIEDYGPKKAGTNLVQAPYKVQPEVGLHPVEIYGSESPVGSSGKNIHWGNAITEVHPKPSRLGGKLGVAGALLGGAGAANAGEYRKAAGDVAEAFLPLGLTPTELMPNEVSDLEARRKMAPTIDKQKGGSIQMPDSYTSGSWKLI
jgi:hypothetical protein